MSADLTPHALLQHHMLEMVSFQWDGTKQQAIDVTREIQRELQMRDGVLIQANVRIDTRTGTEIELAVERRSDGDVTRARIRPHQWLVIHLHEQRLLYIEAMDGMAGAWLFERTRPVVLLHPKRGEISDGPEA